MFDERPEGRGVFFISSSHKLNIENGDEVRLQIGSITVLAKALRIIGDDQFEACVYGFEPLTIPEFKSLKKGQIVTFKRIHIFSCIGACHKSQSN